MFRRKVKLWKHRILGIRKSKFCEKSFNSIFPSGTIVWEELKKLLKDFKPNVENKNFAIRRKHTREVVQYASALNNQVQKFQENYKNKMETMSMNVKLLKDKISELK